MQNRIQNNASQKCFNNSRSRSKDVDYVSAQGEVYIFF